MPTLITTGGASARAYGFGAVSAKPFLGNYYVNTVSFNAQTGFASAVFGTIDSSSNPILWSPYITGGTSYNAITKFDTTGAVVFSKYYDTFSVYGLATYTDSANNIYCSTYNGGGTVKLYKLDSSGAVQWGYTYSISTTGISNLGTFGFAGQSNAATVDSSGNSYIAYYYSVPSVYQILILKIDSSGTLVWKNSYSLSATSIKTATISVDSSGNVWVEGFSGTTNYLIMQISSSGTVNWAYTFNNSNNQVAKAITFDTSGNAWINATGGASGKLFSMNTSGSVLSAYLAPQTFYLNGANGSIYQTDSSQTIAKFSSSGGSASYSNVFNLDGFYSGSGFVLLDKQNSDAILFFGQSGFQIGMSRLPNNGTALGTYPNSGNVINTVYYAPSPVATYSSSTPVGSLSTTTITLTSVTIVSATFSNTVTRTTSTPSSTTITYTTSSTNVSTLTSGYGSQTYQGSGTYSWIAPTGVTSVSVVAIGYGSDSSSTFRGGGLGYINNYSVTPGNSYTVFLGTASQQTYFVNNSTVAGNGGNFSAPAQYGNFVGTGGGRGGLMSAGGGGSGAGGYSGAGGNNQTSAPAGGGGGGGGNGSYWGGGGVSVLGQGSPGTGSTSSYGTGGSGGGNGTTGYYCAGSCCYPSGYVGGYGGNFGGGGSAGSIATSGAGQTALRIMWPGSSRSFPSTNAGAP